MYRVLQLHTSSCTVSLFWPYAQSVRHCCAGYVDLMRMWSKQFWWAIFWHYSLWHRVLTEHGCTYFHILCDCYQNVAGILKLSEKSTRTPKFFHGPWKTSCRTIFLAVGFWRTFDTPCNFGPFELRQLIFGRKAISWALSCLFSTPKWPPETVSRSFCLVSRD